FKGVGPRVAEKLGKLGIKTVEDLLFHLPMRYEDRTRVVPIGSLRVGDEAVVDVTVEHTEVTFRRKRMLLSHVSDGTGALVLRFFHFNASQQQLLARGARLRCFGEIREGRGSLEMVHPEFKLVSADGLEGVDEHLTPIYPATEGLHQLSLRRLTDQALAWMNGGAKRLQDWLPREIEASLAMPALTAALTYVHRPPPDAEVTKLADGTHIAQRRLAFEELLAQQLSLVKLRARARKQPAPAIRVDSSLADDFLARLPFAITAAQRRVSTQAAEDMSEPHPMLRLVQGDVGSGKTVVAALACLRVIEAGYQAAIMAPTEILAEQHYRNFAAWLSPLGLSVAWLSGKQKAAERRAMAAMVGAGEAHVVIGTHALFQQDVEFANLALVVVDEQHRFGVHQRLALRQKGERAGLHPHQLIMTATPIPRTLAMTAYADLDYSVIDELPPGRMPVKTVVIPSSRRADVVERVQKACADGAQAYWVCTLIEESEELQCRAAEKTAEELTHALPDLRVVLVHGRMKPAEKDTIMNAFRDGAIDLLVATTVVEVGVDVPNASLMIIENAERLGLAQLHQLRGRVGRGARSSSCVLLYQPRLSQNARQRLDALRKTTDGFEIAKIDLKLRGPGEVLGTRQTGLMQLRVADVLRDQDLLPDVQQAARRLWRDHPERVQPLMQRWLGDAVQFGQV
ncbi:MAG: ATP-dependent DNA helicase RecG, partial [Gammaproteobacteria bacterium]